MNDLDRVKELLLLVAELDPNARRALLAREVGEDSAVYREVLSLAEAGRADDDGFLQPLTPPADTADEPPPELRIGPYRVESVLGRGGMSIVYRGAQERPVQRAVAIKMLRTEATTPDLLERFEVERRALARLQHTNIARVLDAGTDRLGVPFLAMELVDGPPLTDFCEEHRLDVAERLRAFLRVCQGVQHAHSRGFLHRDLKPSNVLVAFEDGTCVPKVIDFGVARMLDEERDRTRLTGPGQVVGTPAYMSPEQMQAGHPDVDVRADVYSLGVVLYELLAGRLPFERATYEQRLLDSVRATLLDTTPPPPSQHRALTSGGITVPQDLDCVALKAIQGDRTQRYGSVAEFAADVQRVLDGEPIAARPPSTVYLLRRYASRHRVALVFVAALVATLAIGVTGTTIGLIREHERVLELEEKDRRLRASVAQLETTTTRLSRALSDAESVARFFRRMVSQVRTDSLGPDVKLLDAMLATMDELETAPVTPYVKGRVGAAVGETLDRIGHERARTTLEDALVHLGEPDTLRGKRVLLNVLQLLGQLTMADGELEAAETLARDALRVIDEVPELADGERTRFRVILATVLSLRGDLGGATAEHEAIFAARKATADTPESLADAHLTLGASLVRAGDFERGVEQTRLGREGRIATEPPTELRRVLADLFHGHALIEAGRPADAAPVLEDALRNARATQPRDSLYCLLIELHLQRARHAAGLEATTAADVAAVAERAERAGLGGAELLEFRLAAVEALVLDRDPSARTELDEVARRAATEPDTTPTARALLNGAVGTLLERIGEDAAALEHLEPAYTVLADATSAPYPRLLGYAATAARAARALGRQEQAESWDERARQRP